MSTRKTIFSIIENFYVQFLERIDDNPKFSGTGVRASVLAEPGVRAHYSFRGSDPCSSLKNPDIKRF